MMTSSSSGGGRPRRYLDLLPWGSGDRREVTARSFLSISLRETNLNITTSNCALTAFSAYKPSDTSTVYSAHISGASNLTKISAAFTSLFKWQFNSFHFLVFKWHFSCFHLLLFSWQSICFQLLLFNCFQGLHTNSKLNFQKVQRLQFIWFQWLGWHVNRHFTPFQCFNFKWHFSWKLQLTASPKQHLTCKLLMFFRHFTL